MMRWLMWMALAAVAVSAGDAQALQPRTSTVDRECSDDRGVDRCDPAKQREVRDLLQAQPIEALQAEGARVRRAFYVDGYGNDLPLVSFERRAGEEPRVTVSVSVPEPQGRRRVTRISGPVPLPVWEEMLRRSEHFDRALAPKAAGADEPPNICLHAWVVTVEASNPVSRTDPVTIRRKTEDACGSGLAIEYAFDLARWAIELLPSCAALDLKQQRNQVTLLETCGRLSGDTLAAAEVMNRIRAAPFLHPDTEDLRARRVPFTINSKARLNWAGEEASGWEAANALWASKAGGTRFREHTVRGENEGRVRVFGELYSGPHDRLTVAPSEQVWVKEVGLSTWGLETWTVGAPAPFVRPK